MSPCWTTAREPVDLKTLTTTVDIPSTSNDAFDALATHLDPRTGASRRSGLNATRCMLDPRTQTFMRAPAERPGPRGAGRGISSSTSSGTGTLCTVASFRNFLNIEYDGERYGQRAESTIDLELLPLLVRGQRALSWCSSAGHRHRLRFPDVEPIRNPPPEGAPSSSRRRRTSASRTSWTGGLPPGPARRRSNPLLSGAGPRGALDERPPQATSTARHRPTRTHRDKDADGWTRTSRGPDATTATDIPERPDESHHHLLAATSSAAGPASSEVSGGNLRRPRQLQMDLARNVGRVDRLGDRPLPVWSQDSRALPTLLFVVDRSPRSVAPWTPQLTVSLPPGVTPQVDDLYPIGSIQTKTAANHPAGGEPQSKAREETHPGRALAGGKPDIGHPGRSRQRQERAQKDQKQSPGPLCRPVYVKEVATRRPLALIYVLIEASRGRLELVVGDPWLGRRPRHTGGRDGQHRRS